MINIKKISEKEKEEKERQRVLAEAPFTGWGF